MIIRALSSSSVELPLFDGLYDDLLFSKSLTSSRYSLSNCSDRSWNGGYLALWVTTVLLQKSEDGIISCTVELVDGSANCGV